MNTYDHLPLPVHQALHGRAVVHRESQILLEERLGLEPGGLGE